MAIVVMTSSYMTGIYTKGEMQQMVVVLGWRIRQDCDVRWMLVRPANNPKAKPFWVPRTSVNEVA